MLLQTYTNVFLLLNTKDDILKNVVIKQLLVAIDFHSMENTMEVNGDQKLSVYKLSSKYHLLYNSSVIIFHFWVKYPFKKAIMSHLSFL